MINEVKEKTRNKGGRPKKAVRRDEQLAVMCTLLERKVIEYKAKISNASVSEFLRTIGVKGQVDRKIKTLPKEVLQVIGTLNHMAANLNQVAKKKNSDEPFNDMERDEFLELIGKTDQKLFTMIGKIFTRKSFRNCISYCLEDKVAKEKNEIVVKNRAELFAYNQCFGNQKELIQQFEDVRRLNVKLSKPVLHISLSLAPEEKLSKAALADMVEDCAKQLGFDKNQYIAIHHNDTNHQHIHIVANRVGFNSKTVKDNHNYQKIASYCRKMELKYELKQVLSPRRFLAKELRQIPRHDARKEHLKSNIQECLIASKTYNEFENKMKQKGYEIFKARGIAFRDKQKVYTKGSEVDYSLQTIEKILALKPELKPTFLRPRKSIEERENLVTSKAKEIKPETKEERHQAEQSKLLEQLIKPEPNNERVNLELLKKKKRKRHHLHL